MTSHFLAGATAMCCWIAALFFLKFYRDTLDRLFGWFALAFFVFGCNWVGLSVVSVDNENRVFFYIARLAAFLLIFYAIVDKNRAGRR